MSKEIKITVPIFDEEEKRKLENMTLNEVQPAIDEFTKRIIKDKDLAVAQIVIKKQQQEINKLLDIFEGKKLIENETPEYIKENYIPVQKVKDKIEELENYIQENSDEQGYWGNINPDIIYKEIDVLQELLNKGE